MAKSVINITIQQLVSGTSEVDRAKLGLDNLAKASEKVQQALQKNTFSDFMVQTGMFASAISGLSSSLGELSADLTSFDASMRAANTMAGKGAEDYGKLKEEITELSKTIPLAREELANGLYQVISNGVPEDNWITYLTASAKSAVGGIANLGEVVKVTSTIIKNYGLTWDSAQDIQDKIQLTAKNGVTSFEQLAAALPAVTGQAAQLGVSLDEMLAVMSTLTGVTGNTSEVSTQLASVLTALTKESAKSQKMAAEMGISFNAASVQAAGGFKNFLQILDKSVAEYAAKTGSLKESIYAKLFGRAEALRLVSALTGELGDKYSENMSALTSSAGTMDAAFADMAQTATSKAQLVKNAWSGVTDGIGKAAAAIKPFVTPLAMVGQASAGIAGLSRAFVGVANAAKGIVVINGPLRAMGLTAASSRVQVISLARAFGISAKEARLLQIAMRGIGLVAVGAAIYGLVKYFQALTDTTSKAAKAQKELKADMEDRLKDASNISAETQKLAKAEQTELDRLYQAATNEALSKRERAAALDEIKKKYPEYFRGMSVEKTNLGDLKTEYDRLTGSILANAKARAASSKIEQNEELILDIQYGSGSDSLPSLDKAIADQQKKVGDAAKILQSTTSDIWSASGKNGQSQLATMAYNEEVAALNVLEAQRTARLQEVRKLQDINAQLESVINATPITVSTGLGPGTGESGGKGTKAEDVIPDLEEVKNRALSNLNDYDKALADLKKIRGAASQDMIAGIDDLIKKIEEERDAFEGKAKPVTPAEITIESITARTITTVGELKQAISDLQTVRDKVSFDEIGNIDEVISKYQELLDTYNKKPKAATDTKKDDTNPFTKLDGFGKAKAGWGQVKGIAGDFNSLAKAFDKSASAWERFCGLVDGAMGMIDDISSMIQLLKALGLISTVSADQQAAASATTTAAAQADATAQLTDAAAKTYNAHAWIPWVGIGLAAAGVAAMVATMGSLPKFAEGGLAYGPTLGLFGEYPGASNNPEVVAPLDKLKAMLESDAPSLPKVITLRAEGRDLKAVLDLENLKIRRNG